MFSNVRLMLDRTQSTSAIRCVATLTEVPTEVRLSDHQKASVPILDKDFGQPKCWGELAAGMNLITDILMDGDGAACSADDLQGAPIWKYNRQKVRCFATAEDLYGTLNFGNLLPEIVLSSEQHGDSVAGALFGECCHHRKEGLTILPS